MSEYLLEMRNITKIFPGVKALDNVQFNLRAGEIHALVGENGAGKSTFIKTLTGVHQPDGGEIILDGKKVVMSDPDRRAEIRRGCHLSARRFLSRPFRGGKHIHRP